MVAAGTNFRWEACTWHADVQQTPIKRRLIKKLIKQGTFPCKDRQNQM